MNIISFLPASVGGVSDAYNITIERDRWMPTRASLVYEEMYELVFEKDGYTYSAAPRYDYSSNSFVFDETSLDPDGVYVKNPDSEKTYYDIAPLDGLGFIYKVSLSENPVFEQQVFWKTGGHDGVSGNPSVSPIYIGASSIPVLSFSKEHLADRFPATGSIEACRADDGGVWMLSRNGFPNNATIDCNLLIVS